MASRGLDPGTNYGLGPDRLRDDKGRDSADMTFSLVRQFGESHRVFVCEYSLLVTRDSSQAR